MARHSRHPTAQCADFDIVRSMIVQDGGHPDTRQPCRLATNARVFADGETAWE